MRKKLALFDIDCTLINSGSAGMKALQHAAREVFGVENASFDLAGNTDAFLLHGLCQFQGMDSVNGSKSKFFDCYLKQLAVNLADYDLGGQVLPGVLNLLDSLAFTSDVEMGLVTGNIRAGAEKKLQSFGLDRYFKCGGFGDEHVNRRELGKEAIQRACEVYGHDYQPQDVVMIGDSLRDVDCAKAIGCSIVAVATGKFCADELRERGATFVVEDLSDTLSIYEFITGKSADLPSFI